MSRKVPIVREALFSVARHENHRRASIANILAKAIAFANVSSSGLASFWERLLMF